MKLVVDRLAVHPSMIKMVDEEELLKRFMGSFLFTPFYLENHYLLNFDVDHY